MKHDVSKNAEENRNKTKRSFSHTVPKKQLEKWLMSDNFLMNTCWMMRVFQMTAGRFHSNLWNSEQCLTTSSTSTKWLPDNSWMITCEAARKCAQPKNQKATPCEKNNGIPEAQEIGKKSFVRKTMVNYVLDCMHGLFYQTKLRKMSGALSWYFFYLI